MTTLLQFNNVEIDKGNTLSFNVAAGETLVLKVNSPEEKAAVIDMVLDEILPAYGEIRFHGQLLAASKPGSIGWIPARGGLISNLKTWENITLPLWYHHRPQNFATEEIVARWLVELELDKLEWEKFMASPAARLKPCERKLAGLLRGLVQAPQLLLVDAELFDEVELSRSNVWIAALEKFVQAAEVRAVLVVASATTLLPWRIIE
jgi:ABC-type transporter Mla maintaining outer membrane lipid asymmetry ATPase subunit MlaF